MSFDYSNIAATALAQIEDKGREVTINYAGSDSYDPQTDTFTPDSATDTSVRAVFTKFNKKDVDGELIRATDKRLLIAGPSLSETPETGDTVTDGSNVYDVVNTELVQPADTVVLYMVQVRR